MSLNSDKEKYPRLNSLSFKSEYAVSYNDPLIEPPMLYSINYVVEKENGLFVRELIADTNFNKIMEKLREVLNEFRN